MLHDPTEPASVEDEFHGLEDDDSVYCPVCGAENVLILGVCFECGTALNEKR